MDANDIKAKYKLLFFRYCICDDLNLEQYKERLQNANINCCDDDYFYLLNEVKDLSVLTSEQHNRLIEFINMGEEELENNKSVIKAFLRETFPALFFTDIKKGYTYYGPKERESTRNSFQFMAPNNAIALAVCYSGLSGAKRGVTPIENYNTVVTICQGIDGKKIEGFPVATLLFNEFYPIKNGEPISM